MKLRLPVASPARLLPPITSLVEIVRTARVVRDDLDLALRVTGSTLDGADIEERAAEIVAGVLDGLDAPTGLECLLVVRGGEVVARYDVAAIQALADLLHLLAAPAEIARAA